MSDQPYGGHPAAGGPPDPQQPWPPHPVAPGQGGAQPQAGYPQQPYGQQPYPQQPYGQQPYAQPQAGYPQQPQGYPGHGDPQPAYGYPPPPPAQPVEAGAPTYGQPGYGDYAYRQVAQPAYPHPGYGQATAPAGGWGEQWDPRWGAPPYARPDGTPQRPFPVGRRLGFVDSFRSGIRLAGTCGRVLAADKELLLVPLVAMLLGLAVVVPYVQLLGGFDAWFGEGAKVGVVKLFPLMLVLTAIDVFAAATVVGAATIRLSGGNPTLTDGWVQALARAPKLLRFAFAWAVQQAFTAWLRERGRAGQVAANLLDTAWNVATFLAIPVMLYEPQLSATQAVKRSAKLVGQRWGAGLVGNTGLQLAVFVCGLPVVIALTLFGAVFGVGGAVAGLVIGLVAIICVAGALRGIFSAALYRFALTGLAAPGFAERDLWDAFARPNRRR